MGQRNSAKQHTGHDATNGISRVHGSNNIGIGIVEVFFPIRRALYGIERTRIKSIKNHCHGNRQTDVPHVPLFLGPPHGGRLFVCCVLFVWLGLVTGVRGSAGVDEDHIEEETTGLTLPYMQDHVADRHNDTRGHSI